MNAYLIFILSVLLVAYLFQLIVEIVNLSHLQEDLPAEFRDFYNQDKYRTSQKYLRENTVAHLVESSAYTPILIGFFAGGWL